MFPNQFSASLWGDEAFSAVLSQKPFWQMIEIVSHDTSPPLYYICEHFWFELFGHSEVSIRLLSFLFFLGAVTTTALIAKEIGQKKAVFWTGLLMFLNPFLFKYAFEGRMYSILTFTTTLSFYFFIKILLRSSRKNFVGQLAYVLAATAALYSHHFAIFAIFVQGFWMLILPCHPGRIRQLAETNKISSKKDSIAAPRILRGLLQNDKLRQLWVYPAILLLYAPWLPSLYYQTTLVGSGFWLSRPTFKDLLSVLLSFTVGPEKYPLIKVAFLLIIILLIVRRWRAKCKVDLILLSWFLGPLLLTFIVSQFFQSIFFDRYMLFVIPGFALLLATQRRNVISPVILSILAIILTQHSWFYFTHPTKRPFKEFSGFMKVELKKGGQIINWNAASHHLWESKYYGIGGPIYSPGGPLPFYVGTAQMNKKDVIYQLPQVDRLGVITSGSIEEVQLKGYQLTNLKQFEGLKGLWFQKEKSPPSS